MVSSEQATSRTFGRSAARTRERAVARRVTLRQMLPLGLLVLAAALLVGSIFLPYWEVELRAPQYPKGLTVVAYVSHLSGDVREVDGLNHYIGMMALNEAAKLERQISRYAIVAVAVLAVGSFWLRGRWKWLLVLPAILFPIIFAVDLAAWLYYAGHTLDPHAPLSSSIQPFTPPVVGEGKIGQFSTVSKFLVGFYAAVLGAVLTVVATVLSRRWDHGRT